MTVIGYYSSDMVLELDVDATVMKDYYMLEVKGAKYRVEKQGAANGEGEESEQVKIMQLGIKEGVENYAT